MAQRFLFLGLVVAFSAFAHSAPGVWQQLERGTVNTNRGIVKSVELQNSDIYFEIETKTAFGDPVIIKDRLCGLRDGSTHDSDEVRAALLKAKIEMLQESRTQKKMIEFGSGGMWSSCVSFLRSIDS